MDVELRLELLEIAQRDVDRLRELTHRPADECRQTVSVVADRLGDILKTLHDVARREAADRNKHS
jgi:hypothetical protein